MILKTLSNWKNIPFFNANFTSLVSKMNFLWLDFENRYLRWRQTVKTCFCRSSRKKRIPDSENSTPNLENFSIWCQTYLDRGEYSLKLSAKLVKQCHFLDFEKNLTPTTRIWIFCQIFSSDQKDDNKKVMSNWSSRFEEYRL